VPPISADRERATLVTGGGRGIGRAIAETFARQGHDVVVADVDLAAAEECARSLQAAGWSAGAVRLDVTDVDMVRDVVAEVDARSPLATVVNNAGVAIRRPTVDMSPADYDRLMAVNVRGVFFVLQAALRAMVPRGEGSIVNVSSTSAFTASTGPMAAYDASKAAVRMLTQAAAREVAASGVRVNAVAPGTVETDLTLGLATTAELADLAAARVPMARLGLPGEIAAAVAFLASREASYVTGHTLVVDGGWLA
jgi:NAD(P)-dependent dehydrogenase (short-subunit alcohol dehydrogenase family)